MTRVDRFPSTRRISVHTGVVVSALVVSRLDTMIISIASTNCPNCTLLVDRLRNEPQLSARNTNLSIRIDLCRIAHISHIYGESVGKSETNIIGWIRIIFFYRSNFVAHCQCLHITLASTIVCALCL